MKGLRQGRFNSNYKGGCPVINILSRWEWEEVMACPEEEIESLVLKYDKGYRQGTYPSRLDVPAMVAKVKEARESKKIKS